MATVFKQTRRKSIPAGAEIIERRGKRVAEWTSRRRKRRAELTPDGKAVLMIDPNYTVSWFDWRGKRRKVNAGPDKDAALALGAKLEADEMQRRRGLIDPRQKKTAAEGRRPGFPVSSDCAASNGPATSAPRESRRRLRSFAVRG